GTGAATCGSECDCGNERGQEHTDEHAFSLDPQAVSVAPQERIPRPAVCDAWARVIGRTIWDAQRVGGGG
ncbi:MAG: hypothetical protein GY750_21180, partial [Lentisphaerae bacterium]|nr:hypothetical protein [Lentisphaerota bacterium]